MIKAYKYKYNNKELQDELDLNWYDYGVRNYDAALGRWFNPDPLSEKIFRWTPYNYVMNNPILKIDKDGKKGEDWFENEKTGEVMNVKKENKVPESEKGKGWVNIGKDNKFGEKNIPKGEKGTVLKMDAKESKEFMNEQGYELRPKLSYEQIRHDFPANQITPSGGSVCVENLSGVRVVTSRTYVKKNLSVKHKISLFNTEVYFGNSYTNYTKTQYIYNSNNSLSRGLLKSTGLIINGHSEDTRGQGKGVKTVYRWKDASSKLQKYKDK